MSKKITIWALADLHLALGVPDKAMDVFGPEWERYTEKIQQNWEAVVRPEDLVLIPGDITWAMTLEEARLDLEWIDRLPGIKVMIKGNHDYWWSSLSKVEKALPPSLHVIQNTAFHYAGVSVGGARLWDTEEYDFNAYIRFKENPRANPKVEASKAGQEKIFKRELERLEMSLKQLDQEAVLRIAMTHYPPIGADLSPSKASVLLEKYNVDICVFGHLHRVKKEAKLFGRQQGVAYHLTSCDYLDFKPLRLS